jgi:DNA-binding NarL/FixJ family response regulator
LVVLRVRARHDRTVSGRAWSQAAVLVADDLPRSRAVLRAHLSAHGFEVVAEAGSAQGAVSAAREHAPDLCVLDVSMPGDGIAAVGAIKQRLPKTKVVMLTSHVDTAECIESLRAGADGYLAKDMDWDRLPHVLRDVLNGNPAIPRSASAELLMGVRGRTGWLRRALAG